MTFTQSVTKGDADELRQRALQLARRYHDQLADPCTRARLDAVELADLAGALLASITMTRAAIAGWKPEADDTLTKPTTTAPIAELDPPRVGGAGRGHGRPPRSRKGAAAIYPSNAACRS